MSDLPEDASLGDTPDEEQEPHEKPEDWMVPARKDGQEWGDIASHVATASADASDDGHLLDSISSWLGIKGTTATTDRARQSTSQLIANDDTFLDQVKGGTWNPFTDDHRGQYVKALRENETTGPQDFADAWGAGVLQAAQGHLNDDHDQDALELRTHGVSASAEALAGALPNREDFVDASLALAHPEATEEERHNIQQNLMEHFTETGQKPLDAVEAGKTNPEMRHQWYEPFAHHALGALAPTAGGMTLAGPGAAYGAALGSAILPGPGTVAGGFIGGLGGFLAGSYLAGQAQDAALGTMPAVQKWLGQDPETRAREEKESPWMSFGGELAGGASFFSPFQKAGVTLAQNIIGRQLSAAMMGGGEALSEYRSGDDIDWKKISAAAATGELFAGTNPLGHALGQVIPARVSMSGGRVVSRGIDPAAPGGVSEVPIEDAEHYPQQHGVAMRLAMDTSGEFRPEGLPDEVVRKLSAVRSKELLVNGERIEDPILGQHASPHDFDRFSLAHLGTGEAEIQRGHQSIHEVNERGQGIYVSQAPEVHDFYKGTLGHETINGEPLNLAKPLHYAAQKMDMTGVADTNPKVARAEAITNVERERSRMRDIGLDHSFEDAVLHALHNEPDIPRVEGEAHSYDVALHVKGDETLHLDKSVEGQSDYVRKALKVPDKPELSGDPEADATKTKAYQAALKEGGWTDTNLKMSGGNLFDRMTNAHISPDLPKGSTLYASQNLAKKGIKGTRFLDYPSRQWVNEMKLNPDEVVDHPDYKDMLTHNYVIFHDTPVDMLAKDGSIMLPDHMREQTEALARAYKASGSITDAFKAMIGDNSGSLNLNPKPPAIKLEEERARAANVWFNLRWDYNLGKRVQEPLNQMKRELEPFFKLVNPLVPEFEAEHGKQGGNPMGTPLGNLYAYLEGRSSGAIVLANHELAPVADTIKNQNEHLATWGADLERRGLLKVTKWFDDYFKHMWEDPIQAEKAFTGLGMLGNSGSFQKRIYPTISDGLAAGLKLKFTNPLQAQAVAQSQAIHYYGKLEMIAEMQRDGWGSTTRAPNTSPLNGVGMGNSTFYAHDSIARLWNNVNHPGLFHTDQTQGWYSTVLHATNATTALKLANVSVHMMQEMAGAVGSGMDQFLEGAARGQVATAMQGAFRAVPVVGGADFWNFGRRLRNAYESGTPSPAMAKYKDTLDLLAGSNFTALTEGRSINEMVSSNPTLWESFTRNFGGATAGEKIGNLSQAVYDTQMKRLAYDWNGGKDWEGAGAKLFTVPARIIGHAGELFGQVMKTITEPVFGTGSVLGVRGAVIPNVKLGVATSRLHSWLAANPGASEQAKAMKANEIRMVTEGRYGELNQDTVYINKSIKQAANIAMLSVGWKWGTWSNIMAAFGYNANVGRWEANRSAMVSTVTMAASWAMIGSIWQYLHTGTTPLDTDTPFRDMMNFRTGPSKDGLPVRGMQFGEPKEVFDIGKVIMSSLGDPFHTPAAVFEYMMAATNPAFQTAYAATAGEGKDPIGHDISQYPGGWQRYLQDQFSPIFRTIGDQLKKPELTGMSDFEQSWLGNRPSPTYVQDPTKYLKQMEGVRQRNSKSELARARKESAQLEYNEWLDYYIKQKERAMAESGPQSPTSISGVTKARIRRDFR